VLKRIARSRTGGFRQGELLGLQWDGIDFNAGAIAVRRTLRIKGGEVTLGSGTAF
jgi:integrase